LKGFDELERGSTVRWALFHTNRGAWAAAKAMLEAAKSSIEIEQFIFSSQGIGREILDVLTRRAKAGVRVRVLADWFGSRDLASSSAVKSLLAAGGEVEIFNPPRTFFRDPAQAFHRLHRKLVICDHLSLMTGGTCFHDRMIDWRDTVVCIEGPVVNDALAEFEATWLQARTGQVKPPQRQRFSAGNDREWSYLISSPYEHNDEEYDFELFHHLRSAEHSATLTSPYLVPVGRFWSLIQNATERGVRVRVIIPAKSDQPLIDVFSFRYARRLLGHGVEVYGYTEGMLHAKLAVIDGKWGAVGSFNLGIDSLKMNLEGVLVSHSPAFCRALMDQLELDIAHSRPL
jgi:cardiolipin synthase